MSMKLNFTLDAPSPLISYSVGDWIPISPVTDDETNLYDRSTGITSFGAGTPNAIYSFDGTAIWVFGAKRFNHGLYDVTLDGSNTQLDGLANPDIFKQVLFSATSLTQTPHTLQIVNAGNSDKSSAFFDIDFLIWQTKVANGTTSQTIDNVSSAFTYGPNVTTDWGVQEDESTSFNATLTTALDGAAHARFDFVGEYAAVFGTVGPTHGNFSCSVDGGAPSVYSGTYGAVATQQMLCFAGGLATGRHSLTVKNVPVSGGSTSTAAALSALTIDYGQVWASPASTKIANKPVSAIKANPTTIPLIVGVVLGCLLALAIVLGLIYFFWYRRRPSRRRRRRRTVVRSILGDGPMSGDKPPDMVEATAVFHRPISLPPPDHIYPFHGANTIDTAFGTVPAMSGEHDEPAADVRYGGPASSGAALSPGEYSDIPSFPPADVSNYHSEESLPSSEWTSNEQLIQTSPSPSAPAQPPPRTRATRSSTGLTTSSGGWSRASTQRSVTNPDYPASTSDINAAEEKRMLALRASSRAPRMSLPAAPSTNSVPPPTTSAGPSTVPPVSSANPELRGAGAGSKPLPAPPSATSPASPPLPRQLRRDQSIGGAQVIQEEDGGTYHPPDPGDHAAFRESVAIPPAYSKVPSSRVRPGADVSGRVVELL